MFLTCGLQLKDIIILSALSCIVSTAVGSWPFVGWKQKIASTGFGSLCKLNIAILRLLLL